MEPTEQTFARTRVRFPNGLIRVFDTLEEAQGNVDLYGGEVLDNSDVDSEGRKLTKREKAAQAQAEADAAAAADTTKK